jgi:hypothetical protein
MKRPLALVFVYALCALVFERTSLVASALSGSLSVAGALLFGGFVLLRLVVVWVVPGWILWVLIERALARWRENAQADRAGDQRERARSRRRA